MKKVLIYLLLTPLLLIMVLLMLLSVPPVTKATIEKALSYFLEVDANVSSASLSIHGLKAEGTLNTKDTFLITAEPYALSNIIVTLHYNGNVNTFSKVATVELPYIAAVLDATFATDALYLDLNATLLEGSLAADLSLQSWDYHYKIEHLDLDSFRTQQKEPLPPYATGQLSAQGSGIIEDPYTVTFLLSGENLQLEHNATALISPELKYPLPLDLDINGSVGADKLASTLLLSSSLIDANINRLYYDFNRSQFGITLNLNNHQKKIAPISHAFLDLNGSLEEDDLNATYLLLADDYKMTTQQLHYDLNNSDLTLDYRLSSLKTKPLNLQGDKLLFGDLSYGNGTLSLKMDSKAINSPVLLHLKQNQLHVISNNINIKALQNMANQEAIAKGHLYLEADANLSREPLLWKAKVVSKDLKLPWKYRKNIGLKNDLSLTVKANNEANGDIVVRPALWSNIGVINYSALRYKPEQALLFFNLNAKKVKTSYYQVPRLNLRGSLNLKKSRLNTTTLKTSYEQAVIKELTYSKQGVKAHMEFMLSRLERFGRLNPDYKLHGKTVLHYTPEKTVISLESTELGHLHYLQKNKVMTLSGDALPIEQISDLLEQPSIMNGDLNYSVRYSASSIKATVQSRQIRGDGSFSNSVRPFSLDFSTSLKYHKGRYNGQASVKTDNELIKVRNVVVDLSKQQIKSRYKLEIKALEKNTFILPKELKGPLHVSGDFKQDKYQHLSVNLVDFQLPVEWRKTLEANATDPLETNASVQAYNDQGLINFDADIKNSLLQLTLQKSDYDLKSGRFQIHSDLKTQLWLKDTNITAEGRYTKRELTLPKAEVTMAHETITLSDVRYRFKEQNLTTQYRLRLKPYANAPYHTKASLHGRVQTKPELYATLQSDSLGGDLNAYVTNTDLHLKAEDVSVVKLIAFSGQQVPITDGTLDAKIDLHSPSLLDGNLSTLRGRSDINVTDMVLEGVALDDLIATLRDSQDLNLFQGSFSDLPIVRSVKDIPSDLTEKDANSTSFEEMRFLMDINATGLHCSDCAIATEENLIALRGDINLSSETFNAFYVGLLFPNDCAYFIQEVDGNLSEPQVKLAVAGFKVVGGATMSLVSNVGSVLDIGADIIKGTGDAVGDAASYVPVVGEKTDKALTSVTNAPKNVSTKATECTPFYNGAIKHPKPLRTGILSRSKKKKENQSK